MYIHYQTLSRVVWKKSDNDYRLIELEGGRDKRQEKFNSSL